MMEARTYIALLLFFSTLQFSFGQMVQGPDTLVGNEWIRYNQSYYKFSVDKDGVYRISSATLQASGITGAQASGANFRLYNMGRQVPLFVSNNGQFGANDFIEFYGYRNRGEMDQYLFMKPSTDMLHPDYSMYTDTNVYYLTYQGSDIPLRVNDLVNDLSNPPLPQTYYWHREAISYTDAFNDPYFQTSNGGAISYSSYMHGEGFCRASETNSSAQIASLSRAVGGPDASFHLRFTSTNYGNHSFVIMFNSTVIDTVEANNLQIRDSIYVIPSGLLTDNNQLVIDPINHSSRLSLVSLELIYAHTTQLSSAPEAGILLKGQAGSQHFKLNGFPHLGVQPIIYSYNGHNRMIAAVDGSNNIVFNWPQTLSDTRIEITDPSAGIKSITQLEQKIFADHSEDNTEYIVITHPALMEIGTGSEYIQYRISAVGGSYRASAYSIFDLYDQFGYGIEKHPQAIRNFTEYIHRHWPSAKMVYIIGRGIEYNRSRIPGSWESSFFVPTFGRPGSDQLLAATVWDIVARYPISRLAVAYSEDIDIYLDKVKEYDLAREGDQTIESKAWMKNIIHIGGGKEAQEQDDFKKDLNKIGTKITSSDFGGKVSFFQKESTDIIGESQSKQVEKLLHDGSTIINYLGHSSTSTFEFNINDPSEWSNEGRYPIFSAMGCSAGQIHGTLPSLSDKYVQLPNEGAIAFISGSGSQYANALIKWAEPWYEYIGGNGYEGTLGESNLYGLKEVAKSVNIQYTGTNIYRYLLEQQTLQGDPALRFHPAPGPDYLVDRTSVSINPEIINIKLDSFDVSFSIANIGRNLRQTVGYSVSIKSPDGLENVVYQGELQSNGFETPVHLRLPLLSGGKPGAFRLLINVDHQHQLEELPTPQAEDNNLLTDNLGTIGIPFIVVDNVITAVFPPDFGIVNTAIPVLTATSSNSFIKRQDIVLEIDTTALFNSPSKIRERFAGHSATLQWTPQMNYVPDRVYFWRVSTDSISPEQTYLWSTRSFIYKPGSPNGWNQSHFHQLTENTLNQLLPDSTIQHFKFASTLSNFRILNRYQNAVNGVPFGFIDGVFYTEFFSKFVNNDVNVFVVAINPVTGEFMTNPNPGLYGSFNNLSYDARCFAYRTDLPADRQALINFIENIIPDDFLIFFYTYQRTGRADYFPQDWESDEAIYGKSIFSVIENQYPTSAIRTLATTGSKPYIVFFQKGKGGIEEVIAIDTIEAISVDFDIPKSLDEGAHISTLIGPSSQWSAIQWKYNTTAPANAGVNILSARALSSDLSDTLLISNNIVSEDTSITSIDAKAYPFIQLTFSTQDSLTFHPSDILYWRVLYEGYPEFIIHPDVGFEFIADTLYRGQEMSLSTYITNLSDYDVDSLPVSLRIIGEDNHTEGLNTVIGNINKHSNAPVHFQKSTEQLRGRYQVVMEIDPNRTVNEIDNQNNIGILPMVVISDDLNPVLDVTFDGQHILDGDLVASRPVIAIRLHDESTYLRLDDTSSFNLYLQYPSQSEPQRLSFNENWIQFSQAPGTGKNEASVELTPELLEDGIYHLQVRAVDASGNLAGDNDYFISFEVINEESISHLYNYPNPFSTSTKFVYTLTGAGSPPFYKIQIMSVSGRIVREITQDELGPLTVGTHMTDYIWDGTDEHGGRLAAGTYLYRMVVKNEDMEDLKRYNTSGDDTFFTKGWGKLVILR